MTLWINSKHFVLFYSSGWPHCNGFTTHTKECTKTLSLTFWSADLSKHVLPSHWPITDLLKQNCHDAADSNKFLKFGMKTHTSKLEALTYFHKFCWVKIINSFIAKIIWYKRDVTVTLWFWKNKWHTQKRSQLCHMI